MAGPSPAELTLWDDVAKELLPWFARARTKRAFDFQATGNAVIVPFTAGRIGAIMAPTGAVWLGGDGSLSANNGLPLSAGMYFTFGPEEGNSYSWLISAGAAVDVRCFELLP